MCLILCQIALPTHAPNNPCLQVVGEEYLALWKLPVMKGFFSSQTTEKEALRAHLSHTGVDMGVIEQQV